MKRRAFTLIELLVVIAIIAVLMGILMPSLRAAKDHARRVHCVANVKTLSLGWYLYQDDNDGELVPGHTNPGQWVDRPRSGDNVEQKKDAIRRGLLFPYVGKKVDVYACPADQRDKDPSQYTYRSFSIAGGANGESWGSYNGAKKYTDLKKPAQTYIFVEEIDPRGFNVGSWQMNPGTSPNWVDPVAMWHNRQSSLGYADGHAEMHRWMDTSFIEWNLKAMYNQGFSFNMTPPASEREDINFMNRGFPYKSLK
ncbi:MAG: type II secretion system protein [Planctomycetota bacterium]